MDKRRMDEPGGDPRFIPGIYNYCDRWCERCAFTSRCMNYAMGQEMESSNLQLRNAENKAFWDKLHETFESTMEMIEDEAEEMDFDMDEEELQESIRDHEDIIFASSTLRRLLRQVESAFPTPEPSSARDSIRPIEDPVGIEGD